MFEGLIQTLQPTPEAPLDEEGIKRRRRLAENLIAQGTDASPIRSPWQGAARLAQALLGGWEERKADQAEAENARYNSNLMNGLLVSPAEPGAPLSNRSPNSPHPMTAAAETSSPVPQPTKASPNKAAMLTAAGDNLPRGLRNFNPGSIEDGRFAQSQPGYAGTDGRFAKFDTLEHGVGAQESLLGSYGNRGLNTVAGIVNRYAPAAENGSATNNYAAFVSKRLGVDANAPLNMADPNIRHNLAMAMGEFENGRPIKVASNDAGKAFASAAPGPVPAAQAGQAQKILAAMADPRLTPQNKQILALMYQNAVRDDQRFTAPHMDPLGNYVQEGSNGQVHVLKTAPQQFQAPYKDEGGNVVQRGPDGQIHVLRAAPTETKTKEIQNYEYGQAHPDFSQAQKKQATISQDAIDLSAERELAGDHSWVTGLGRGAQGAENILAVQERAAQLAKERGMGAEGIKQNVATFGGQKAGARALHTLDAKFEALSASAGKAGDLAIQKSNALPRGNFVPLNKVMQMGQAAMSNPALAEFHAASNTLANEYSRAVGGGVPTDAARHHALEMLSEAQSPEAYQKVVRVLQREIQITHEALQGVMNKQGAAAAASPSPLGKTQNGVTWSVE